MVDIIRTKEGWKRLHETFKNDLILACDTEGTSLDIRDFKLEGIGIGNSKKQFYIPFPNEYMTFEEIGKELEKVFQKEIVFHHAKFDLQVLWKYGFPTPEKIQDTMIMSWLLDEDRSHGLKSLATDLLKRTPKDWKDLKHKIDLFTSKEDILKEMANYCGADVKNTFDLYILFEPQIKKFGFEKDYYKIELPIILVLGKIEYKGIKINKKWLRSQQMEIEKVLNQLENDLKEMAGGGVNIHSPQQLEKILFEKLGYDSLKTTQGGKRSTDNKVLAELVKKNKLTEDDFVPKLLKFRDLDKVYRTYILALQEQGRKEGVVHTSFLQHGTRTGRLASRDPNLQNIPARHDEWDIRQAFVPRKGFKFVISDYSQIELRVLAHFSQDSNMLEVFKNDGDIHNKTMELTGTERRVAKAINFGLIYGMGPRSLARTLDISEEDAKLYIDKFFAGYPRVKGWIRMIENSTLKRYYVTTIVGRRRRFQKAADQQWFNTIKRQCVNTKIQGSAADIIKVAMIKLDPEVEKLGGSQLLQIHDEVIVEVPEGKAEEAQKTINEIMESAVSLRVPLKVHSEIADCWVKD